MQDHSRQVKKIKCTNRRCEDTKYRSIRQILASIGFFERKEHMLKVINELFQFKFNLPVALGCRKNGVL